MEVNVIPLSLSEAVVGAEEDIIDKVVLLAEALPISPQAKAKEGSSKSDKKTEVIDLSEIFIKIRPPYNKSGKT
jgi:hypothetical protein